MIYQFGNQFSFTPLPRASKPLEGVGELNPQIDFTLPTMQQQSDVGGQTEILHGVKQTEPIEVREFIEPGFHYLDAGMKKYFGDIRIPSKDSVRFMRAKISGMKRGIETWRSDLKHGRVKLPVIAISRGSHSYNPEKFSPPHHPMRLRYTNRDRSRVSMIWRPVPWLVEYTLTIWAESKRDGEYAINQILTRFNPLAEFRVSDNHIDGTITLRFGGCNDTSDKEVSPEQLARVKYEITTTAEAWLSLPEQVVPTILGTYGGIKTGSDYSPWDRFNLGAVNG